MHSSTNNHLNRDTNVRYDRTQPENLPSYQVSQNVQHGKTQLSYITNQRESLEVKLNALESEFEALNVELLNRQAKLVKVKEYWHNSSTLGQLSSKIRNTGLAKTKDELKRQISDLDKRKGRCEGSILLINEQISEANKAIREMQKNLETIEENNKKCNDEISLICIEVGKTNVIHQLKGREFDRKKKEIEDEIKKLQERLQELSKERSKCILLNSQFVEEKNKLVESKILQTKSQNLPLEKEMSESVSNYISLFKEKELKLTEIDVQTRLKTFDKSIKTTPLLERRDDMGASQGAVRSTEGHGSFVERNRSTESRSSFMERNRMYDRLKNLSHNSTYHQHR